MDTWSPGLTWFVVGLVLLGLELTTGTFVMLFFAAGAFLVAGMAALQLVESIVVQVVLFGVVSCAGLLVFKEKLKSAWGRSGETKFMVDTGQVLILATSIEARGEAEVTYQGTKWTAINESEHVLKAGERATIARVDGVKLILK